MKIELGTIDTFANFETVSIRMCKLDTNRIIIVYVKGSNSRPYGTIYDLDESGSRTHIVTQLLWDQDVGGHWDQPIDCCQVDTNKFLVAYNEGTGYKYRRARFLTVSGSVITDQGMSTIGDQHFPTVEQIATNKIVFSNSLLGTNGSSFIGTCSGVTLTWGNQALGEFTTKNAVYFIRNIKLNENKWAVVFTDNGIIYGAVGTTDSGYDAAGRLVAYGGLYTLENTNGKYIDGCSPDIDKFVVTFEDDNTSEGHAVICTVSAKIITVGSPIAFGTNVKNTACCPWGSDHFVVAYVDVDDSWKGKVKLYEINWDTRTASLKLTETFESGSTGGETDLGLDIILTDPNTFEIAYQDDIDNDYGKIIEGNVIIIEVPIINGIGGDSENIINISETYGAISYNIYWSLTSGVTIENGTKIENVTRPYKHIKLTKQNYYYIVTAENAEEEGDPSNEICLKPDFEGKIFDHIDQIKNSLLYQYQGD